ncbi:MAG: hypothetical protein II008_01425, partial [Oscillospiraceae bacterium]|nr:hypothetical protein [Oscillospiraceae bacterium]
MKESVIERNKRLGVDRKIADFMAKQKQSYEFKIRYAEMRAREFYEECGRRDLNCHVSVGGLDSITLLVFLRKIGIDVPAISVSGLEDKSIQRVHEALGVERVKSYRSKVDVIREFGFPVLSKEIAGKIMLLQNPSEKNRTVRHAIITGETGEYGGNRTGTRMQLPRKWLERFGGADEEGRALGYLAAPFKVSDRCCYYLKEKPCDDWAKAHNSVPYLGLMASEGGRREKALMMHGCNYFGETTIRSAPFAIFDRQDVLRLAVELDVPVPEIYGRIVREPSGKLRTTKAQRTGCSMCGFGIHLDKRPHTFDLLYDRNPEEWDFWMKKVGWGEVLDYIGVPW